MFDSQANFQGEQTGWFAKLIKDKFNIKLNIIAPNVAGGGDTLYQTRSANGNLGDLIITNLDSSRLKDMVTAGLVLDMSDYINAPSLRWDVYGEVGYPEMDTLEDMIPVLEQMQEKAKGTSKDGKDVYALSLFKDWDGDTMQNAGAFCALYGYENLGFALGKVDVSEIQSVIDPESTTQNFDTLQTKFRNGDVLYSFWPWLGAGVYNTTENTSEGKGFASATIKDMKCLSYGSMPDGKMSVGIMVGSQTKDPQRMVDFINWLYSPEGIEASSAQSGGNCGPEGLTWEMKDGKPVLTDFGVKAFVDIDESLKVPDEWGSGTWKDGVSALNFKANGIVDTDPDTGICYNYQRWDDYLEKTSTKLKEDWSAHNDGDTTEIEHFEKTGNLLVLPGTNYSTPEYSTDISTIKEQCKQTIVADSWQMVFAKNEAEFNKILKDMQDTVKGLGYDQVFEVDKKDYEDKVKCINDVLSESK